MTHYPLEPLAKHLGIHLGQIGGHQPMETRHNPEPIELGRP